MTTDQPDGNVRGHDEQQTGDRAADAASDLSASANDREPSLVLMGPELSPERFRKLNGDISLSDELGRENDIAKTVLTAGMAGALASSSVAAAASVGKYAYAFVAAAVLLALAAGAGLFSLSIPGIRRTEQEQSPWAALGQKRGLNRTGLGLVFLALFVGLLVAGVIRIGVL